MLSVAVQKDIGEYEQRLIGGMTIRTSIVLAAAVAASALTGLAAHALLGLALEDAALAVMAVAGGTFLAGWARPLGMPVERAAPLLLRAHLHGGALPGKTSLCLVSEELAEARRREREEDMPRRELKAARARRKRAAKRIRKSKCPELELPALSRAAERPLGLNWTGDTGDWDDVASVIGTARRR